jgi:hypothetical protein
MVKRLLKPHQVEQHRANGWDVTRHYYELRRVASGNFAFQLKCHAVSGSCHGSQSAFS